MNCAIEINLFISIYTQTAASLLILERKVAQLQKEIQHAHACALIHSTHGRILLTLSKIVSYKLSFP